VTVVLGKNNSGKSALVRAPLVFATGFGVSTAAPLDLERLEAEPVDAFTDLIFEGSAHGNIKVEFDVDGDRPFRLAATVQNVSETRDAFVSGGERSRDRGRFRIVPGSTSGSKRMWTWLRMYGDCSEAEIAE
jgi:hypothetical protein